MNDTDPDNSIDIPNSSGERHGDFQFPQQPHDRKTSLARLVASPAAPSAGEAPGRTGAHDSESKLRGDNDEVEPDSNSHSIAT